MLKTSLKSIALVAAVFGSGALMAQTCNTNAWGVDLSPGQGVAGAPLAGSPTQSVSRYSGRCGLQSDAAGEFVRDGSPADEPTYIARFYVKPNVTTGTAVLFQALDDAFPAAPAIQISQTGTQLGIAARGATSTNVTITANRWYAVEVNWTAGGNMTYSVQGNGATSASTGTLTGVTAGTQVDQASLGWISGGSGGDVTTDAFESRRTQPIGRLCRGDANGDTFLGAQDRVQIVNEILGTALAAGQPDVTEDGFVGAADRVQIVNRILAGDTCP